MADELTEKQIVSGAPVDFEVDGHTFYVRQPTTEEYDDAQMFVQFHEAKLRALPDMQEAAKMPCSEGERISFEIGIKALEEQMAALNESDKERRVMLKSKIASMRRQLEGRTLADELVSERVLLKRDRYMVGILLLDGDKEPVGNKVSLKLSDAARPYVWKVMRAVEEAPFV